MAKLNYQSKPSSVGGCGDIWNQAGYYLDNKYIGHAGEMNPATGQPYTAYNMPSGWGGGGGAASGGAASGGGATSGGGAVSATSYDSYIELTDTKQRIPLNLTQWQEYTKLSGPEQQAWIEEQFGVSDPKGWTLGPSPSILASQGYQQGQPGQMPSFGNIAGQVPAAPAYKPSAEVLAWQEEIGGRITDVLEQGGIGMPEETKKQLFLREAETINASTAQAIKNLEDEMAAKGMSNSGLAFSEKMKADAKGTAALANVMRDVEIQDALMKLSSYENTLSMGVQFMTYLSEESYRQYQPKLATWGAQVEMYKLAVQQAYTEQNYALAHHYNMEMAQFEADTQIELAEMELEASNNAAKAKGAGTIVGAILGGIFGS